MLCLVLLKGLLGEMGKPHYHKEVFGSLMEVRGPFFIVSYQQAPCVDQPWTLGRENHFRFFVQDGLWLPSFCAFSSRGHLESLLSCVCKKLTRTTGILTVCFLTLASKGVLHRGCLRGAGVRVCESQQQQYQLIHLRGGGAQVLLVPGERAVL